MVAAAARFTGAARFAGAAGRGDGRLSAAAGRAARGEDEDFGDGLAAAFGAGFFAALAAGAGGFAAFGAAGGFGTDFVAIGTFAPLATGFAPFVGAGFALAAAVGVGVGFAFVAGFGVLAGFAVATGAETMGGAGAGFGAGAVGFGGCGGATAAAGTNGFATTGGAGGFAATGAAADEADGLEATGFVNSGRIFAMAARSAAFSAAFLRAMTRGSTDWCTIVTRGASGFRAVGLAGSALPDERLADLLAVSAPAALPGVSLSAALSMRRGRSYLSTFSRSSSVVSRIAERTTFAKRTCSPMEW